MASNCSMDDAFGPVVAANCRSGFDFTLLFEQSILILLPSAAFVITGLLRLASLLRLERRTKDNHVRVAKLTATLTFAAVQLAIVVAWSRSTTARTRLSVPAVAVNFVAAVLLAVISWLEDARNVRPSTLVSIYLLGTVILDSALVRTMWLLHEQQIGATETILPALLSASIAIKLGLLLLESHEKRRYLRPPYAHLPPEPTSGILNRSVLWWLLGLFRRGLVRNTMIAHDDLYELDDDLASAGLAAKASRAWDTRRRPERRFEFAWAVYRALWWPHLVVVVFPRLCKIGFTFAQPFLILRVLTLLSNPVDSGSTNKGYGLIGATALIYLGIAVSTLHYNHNVYRYLTMFRGAAVSLVYRRCLSLRDGVYDESAAVTLMSTDVDRIVQSLLRINELWARTIEVIVGVVLLALQLGWVAVLPIVMVAVSFGAETWVSKHISKRQKVWVEATQKRVAVTSSMLADMRGVKMLGLSRVLTAKVQGLRVYETNRMAGYRWFILWLNVVAFFPEEMASVVTFVAYAIQASVRGTPSIDATKAFTSLSIITLLTVPAAELAASIPFVTSSFGCFDRIQAFLLSPARVDHRQVFGPESVREPEVAAASSSGIELVELTKSPGEARQTTVASARTPAISVENINVHPALDADLALHNVSFSLERGSVTMVLGRVGSGKTTLLKAVLGELPCGDGKVTVSTRRMALCSQNAWLPNTTIRQAICGVNADPEDEAWYQTTVKACALDVDFALMPKSDATAVGAGSTELSGGQKHRVALARAVYARADIVLLDDVLSALDAKTAAVVMDQLFGEQGLFRKLQTTVLFVTHSTKYLSCADRVLVLADNTIAANGPPDEIRRQYSYIDDTASSTPAEASDSETQEAPGPTAVAKKNLDEVKRENRIYDLTRATGDFSVYKYYLQMVGWRLPLLFMAVNLLEAVARSFTIVLLNFWADVNGGQVALYSSLYFLLGISTWLLGAAAMWVSLIKMVPVAAQRLHYKVLKTVMHAPASYISQTDSGTILNRFSQDMAIIEAQLGNSIIITFPSLCHAVAGAGLIATGSVYMVATVPLLIAVIYGVQYVYLRTSRQLRFLDLENRSPLYSHFLESLAGLSTIRAFGWEAANRTTNLRLLDFSQRPYYLLYCVQRWLNLVLDMIVAAEAVVVVGLALGLRGSTSAGLLGIALNNVLSFNSSLARVVEGYTTMETSLGSVARVREFERDVKPEDKPDEDVQPPPTWPQKGTIEFNGVTASHNPKVTAIHDVTLTIQAGQKVGIVGRTGSGKSSLVATLLRLLEMDSGMVTVDGIRLDTIPRETIRERLVVVPQDPLLLAGSVRSNLDPEGLCHDADMVAALERVSLWEDILQHRGGLDAELTSGSLSRGQQQLFALARALLKIKRTGARVLLLDEATSSVDAATAATMQHVLASPDEGDCAKCTTLAVAHRIETVLGCDVVVVMDAGRIVEAGPPQELLKKPGGQFATLAQT